MTHNPGIVQLRSTYVHRLQRGMPLWRYPSSLPHTPVSLAGPAPRPESPGAHYTMGSYIISPLRYTALGLTPSPPEPHCCTCCRLRPCRSACFACRSCWERCGVRPVWGSGGCCSVCCVCGGSEWWRWQRPQEGWQWERRVYPQWSQSCHSLLWLLLFEQTDPLHAVVNLKEWQKIYLTLSILTILISIISKWNMLKPQFKYTVAVRKVFLYYIT